MVVYQITYKDGTIEIVERCWLVESRPRSRKQPLRVRWAVQRHAGTKLRFYEEEDIVDAKYEDGFDPSNFELTPEPGPRKAG